LLRLPRKQRDQARRTLRELSDALLSLRPASVPDLSLARGHTGIALVHHVLDGLLPERGHARRAQRAFDRAIDDLSRTTVGDSLFHGFTGVGWTALLIGRSDANDEIDAALATRLSASPWRDRFGVSDGLAGMGVYALERGAPTLVARVLDRLEESSERRRPGIAWRSRREWVPGAPRAPEWSLGVAHGTPGVIAVLARIVARSQGDERRRALRLLDGAVRWLLAHERRDGGFAIAVGRTRRARLAWCYGEAGVASALQLAAITVGERRWAEAALRIGRAAAARSFADSGVLDGGLCHGAAGLMHLFHRLYQRSGDERFAAAARAWLDQLLALRRADGFGGFAALATDHWVADPGLLFGAGGVALALAALLGGDASWDRAFALS
jgi:hypothetical protein